MPVPAIMSPDQPVVTLTSSDLIMDSSMTSDPNFDPDTSQDASDGQDEVMGTPGRVKDMIALFSSPASKKLAEESNGTAHMENVHRHNSQNGGNVGNSYGVYVDTNLPPRSPQVPRSPEVITSPRTPKSATLKTKITNWEQGIFVHEDEDDLDDTDCPNNNTKKTVPEAEVFFPIAEKKSVFLNNDIPDSTPKLNGTRPSPKRTISNDNKPQVAVDQVHQNDQQNQDNTDSMPSERDRQTDIQMDRQTFFASTTSTDSENHKNTNENGSVTTVTHDVIHTKSVAMETSPNIVNLPITLATNGYQAEDNRESSTDHLENGSEPSLAGSRNGHRSASVMASKQSIISRDSVSPMRNTPGGSTDASSVDATQQGEPVVGNTSPLPSTPKTPSYLRLSCINSGYSRYSGYGLPREMARIRVIKKSEHNSSLSSVSSSSTSIGSTEAAGQESDSTSRMTLTQGHPDPKGHDQLGQGQQNGDLPTSDPDTSGQASLNGLDNVDSSKVLKQREKTENQKSDVVKQTPLNGHESADLKINLNAETTPPQTRKDQSRKDSLSVSPSKDGNYYIKLMENTAEQLRSLANVAEKDLEKNLPEEASGKLRAAVGKVNLLITKKFKQFRGLCEQNLNQSEEESFRTTNQDLAGFWDMVLLQVEDLDGTFKEIDKIRNNNWQMSPVHVKKPERPTSASRMKSPRTKDSTPKSAKSIEMQRQREEARRRLLEAKKKGRERKASQSKDDEIEIFVPQD